MDYPSSICTLQTTVGIVVVNINDNSPRFQNTPYRKTINDTTPVDTWVYTVVATDGDIGPDGNITFSIFDGNTGGVFRIDAKVRLEFEQNRHQVCPRLLLTHFAV